LTGFTGLTGYIAFSGKEKLKKPKELPRRGILVFAFLQERQEIL
jgi:hypothetical protein